MVHAWGSLCRRDGQAQQWHFSHWLPVLSQDVADKKKRISDEDLLALMADEVYQAQVIYELIDLQVLSERTPVLLCVLSMLYARSCRS